MLGKGPEPKVREVAPEQAKPFVNTLKVQMTEVAEEIAELKTEQKEKYGKPCKTEQVGGPLQESVSWN